MKWIKVKERLPNSEGIYGTSMCLDEDFHKDGFDFMYFDGKEFKFINCINKRGLLAIQPKYWCKLEIGKD